MMHHNVNRYWKRSSTKIPNGIKKTLGLEIFDQSGQDSYDQAVS